jgi:hypothetical protein
MTRDITQRTERAGAKNALATGLLSACLVLCPTFGVATSPARAAPVPEALQPFVTFVEQCERYEQMALGWEPVYVLDLTGEAEGGGKAPGYELVPERPGVTLPEAAKDALKVDRDKDRDVLVVDAEKLGPALLAFGPPVTGDFRAEFEAKIVSDKVCDLSLVCNGVGKGPGLQFGTQDNTRNFLWPGQPGAGADPNNPNGPAVNAARVRIQIFGPGGAGAAAGAPAGAVELPKDRLILRRSWHQVRLEISNGSVSAYVDGRLVGNASLAPGFDRTAPQRAMLFTNGCKVIVADARVEQYKANLNRPGLAEAWPTVFGELTQDQVDARIAELIPCLNDADAAVREAAEKLLARVGHLAEGPLEKAAGHRGTAPEARRRADGLLKALREQPTAPDNRQDNRQLQNK